LINFKSKEVSLLFIIAMKKTGRNSKRTMIGKPPSGVSYNYYLREIDRVTFPQPTGVNVNMMPFVMGDDSTIPEECKGYIPIIQECLRSRHHFDSSEIGKVGYLTIQEGFINEGDTQRRPGLHTDGHLNANWGYSSKGDGQLFHGWGGLEGGIYMANNIDGSCVAWDTLIEVSNWVL
jgi:hypothetical protein